MDKYRQQKNTGVKKIWTQLKKIPKYLKINKGKKVYKNKD